MFKAGPAQVPQPLFCSSFDQTAGHVRVKDGELLAHGCSAGKHGGGAAWAEVAALPQARVAYFQSGSIRTIPDQALYESLP